MTSLSSHPQRNSVRLQLRQEDEFALVGLAVAGALAFGATEARASARNDCTIDYQSGRIGAWSDRLFARLSDVLGRPEWRDECEGRGAGDPAGAARRHPRRPWSGPGPGRRS